MTKYTIIRPEAFEVKAGKDEIEVWGESARDEHHSMHELYEHRNRLFIALLKVYDNILTPLDSRGSSVRCWKSKKHYDETMYDGYFIAGLTKITKSFNANDKPEIFDITYHLPLDLWPICNVIELPLAPKYDEYTPFDVLDRLFKL